MSIHEAIRNNDQSLLETLLSGINIPEYKDDDGQSLLHLAAHCGNADLVKRFIETGCDVNSKNSNDTPPLMCIMSNQDMTKRAAVVELLVKAGADVRYQDDFENTALHYCFPGPTDGEVQPPDFETAKILLDHGADVNIGKDDKNNTALHLAVKILCLQYNHSKADDNVGLKVIKILLAHGANVNLKNNKGKTPFHLIVKEGSEKHIQLFLDHGADLYLKDKKNQGPIHFAATNESVDVLRLLLDKGCNVDERTIDSETPLHLAARDGKRENIQLLCDRGADINAKSIDGRTPLHGFILTLDCSSYEKKVNKRIDYLYSLFDLLIIKLGANVNALDRNDRTILDMTHGLCYKRLILSFLAIFRFLDKNIDKRLVNQIENRTDDRQYFQSAMEELSKIRNFTFHNGAPIWPIVIGDHKVVMDYARNADIVKQFDNLVEDGYDTFPIYIQLLKLRFESARYERKLRIDTTEILYGVLIEIPGNAFIKEIISKMAACGVFEKVVDYLSLSDLQKIIENSNTYL